MLQRQPTTLHSGQPPIIAGACFMFSWMGRPRLSSGPMIPMERYIVRDVPSYPSSTLKPRPQGDPFRSSAPSQHSSWCRKTSSNILLNTTCLGNNPIHKLKVGIVISTIKVQKKNLEHVYRAKGDPRNTSAFSGAGLRS